jgi:hypothetical protein
MQKDTFGTLIAESFGTLIVSLALTRFLAPQDRGEYSTLVASIFLLSFLGNNAHIRVVYFRKLDQYPAYINTLFISLMISTLTFSATGTLLFFMLEDFSYVELSLVFFSSIGMTFYNFIVAVLSIKKSHLYLRKFSLIAFLLQILNAFSIMLFQSPTVALVLLSVTFWIPILVVFWRTHSFGKLRISSANRPNLKFIKENLFPRLLSLPVYISTFDALKFDILLCNYFLGYRATGNYVAATTISVSLQFLYRFLFLSNLTASQNRLLGKKKFFPIWSYFILGLISGLIFVFWLPFIIESLFPRGYSINRLDFSLIWCGNMLFWARRLLGDLFLNLNIDKWIGISEVFGALSFALILQIRHPETLRDFSEIYCLSLIFAFLLLCFVCIAKAKYYHKNGNVNIDVQ